MDFLLEHIKVDLQEENGHIPFLNLYEKAFTDALPGKFKSGETFIIDETAFQGIEDRFFADTQIDVTITRLTDLFGPNITSRSYYESEGKDFVGTDDKLHGLKIILDFGFANGGDIRKHITKAFEHELLHAYQSYKERYRSNTPIGGRISGSGYVNAVRSIVTGQYSSSFVRNLAAFTYLMSGFERNANLGALRAELKDRVKEFYSARNLSKVLEQLDIFKQYRAAERFVEYIRQSSEWISNPQYLKQVNGYTGHTFKTPKQAKHWILDTWRKWDRKFKNTAGRVIWEIIQEYDLESHKGIPGYGVNPYTLFDEFVNQDKYWRN